MLLPEGHGIIFANGYYLQTGEYKLFESGLDNMRFQKRISSINGEDTLFVFLNPSLGHLYFAVLQHDRTTGRDSPDLQWLHLF